jgi:hypothetical protein
MGAQTKGADAGPKSASITKQIVHRSRSSSSKNRPTSLFRITEPNKWGISRPSSPRPFVCLEPFKHSSTMSSWSGTCNSPTYIRARTCWRTMLLRVVCVCGHSDSDLTFSPSRPLVGVCFSPSHAHHAIPGHFLLPFTALPNAHHVTT